MVYPDNTTNKFTNRHGDGTNVTDSKATSPTIFSIAMTSPLSPTAGVSLFEFNQPEMQKNSPAFRLLRENQVKAEKEKFELDSAPVDRERSKTLPRKSTFDKEENDNMIHSSGSLPRSKNAGPPNKAPAWYKQMYKEMHSSMEGGIEMESCPEMDDFLQVTDYGDDCIQKECQNYVSAQPTNSCSKLTIETLEQGESHLTKLLSSDAKRGAFRKYDGASTMDDSALQRSSNSVSDVPRRLGGGRSIATHHHRKSLPNIHASNFNFMNATSTPTATTTTTSNSRTSTSITVNMRQNKPDSTSGNKQQEHRKSINSEWYKQLQKGGEIPETGLTSKITVPSPVSTLNKKEPIKVIQATKPISPTPYLNDSNIKSVSKIKIEYNSPPDFLELRRRELKNKELEDEREMIREMREKERLAEEERLRKQRELDRKVVEEEKRRGSNGESLIQPVYVKTVESSPTSPLEITPRKSTERAPQYNGIDVTRKLSDKSPYNGVPEPQITSIKKSSNPSTYDIEKELEELNKEYDNQLPAEYGKAKYSFHPQGPGELEFKKGETIHLLQLIDENWIEGEIHGQIGIFPVSYIEYLKDNTDGKPKVSTSIRISTSSSAKPPNNSTSTIQEKPIGHVEPFVQSEPIIEQKTRVDPVITDSIIKATEEFLAESAPSAEEPKEEEVEVRIDPGFAKAKYTFKAESKNELNFRKGDMIKLLRQVDDNWYEGENNNEIGILPVSYIEVLKEPTVEERQKPEPVSEFIQPKQHQTVESSIEFEEIFKNSDDRYDRETELKPQKPKVKQSPPRNDTKNEAYIFNNHNGYHDDQSYSNHIDYNQNRYNKMEQPKQINHHPEEPSLEQLSDGLIGQGDPYRVMYTYNKTNDDEVSLKVGDVVNVLEKCDDGWYVGTCQRTGAFGIFPGNYVKPVT